MNIDGILPVPKKVLLVANAVVWGAPGVKIVLTGIQSYRCLGHCPGKAWLITGTFLVIAAFVLMFRKIVKKYSDRILSFPQRKKSILAFLPPRGWILVTFMMCLGICLKFIPGIPLQFFACFYSGIGPALIIAALLFLARLRS